MKLKPFTDYSGDIFKEESTQIVDTPSKVYDISVLNGFTKNYSEFATNLEKAESFINQFESLSKELETLVSRDEFETVLASHIIHINESIESLKSHISGINQKDLVAINESIKIISNKVKDVVKEVSDQSIKNSKVLFEESLKQDQKIQKIKHVVDLIDEQTITEKLVSFDNKVNKFGSVIETILQEELPKHEKTINKFVVENSNAFKEVDNKTNRLSETVVEKFTVVETEIADVVYLLEKNKKETNILKKIVTENDEKQAHKLNHTKKEIEEKISKGQDSFSKELLEVNKQNLKLTEQVKSNTKVLSEIKEEAPKQTKKVVSLESDITLLQKDIKNIKSDKRVLNLEEKVKSVESDLTNLNEFVVSHNNRFDSFDDQIKEMLTEVKKVGSSEKYAAINSKINHIEKVLKEFNEKKLLKEDIFPNPSAKTKDPLTPLNQNFVTFDQLKQHYSLFINRIQTQMMAVGGGGAGYLPDLMDVSIYSTPSDGEVLKYVSANAKWESGVVATSDQDLNTTNSVSFANITSTGNVVVLGDLVVLGNTTTISSSTLTVNDKNITVASGAADSAAADGAGINVDGAQANLVFLSASDTFDFNKSVSVNGNLVLTSSNTTSDLQEGTNLYYTDVRAFANLTSASTTSLSEGTNLYFTNTRARQAISVSGDLSYDSANGIISFTNDAGDIEAVTAGSGLTGGGTSGSVTLDVGSGYGITVNADGIEITNAEITALVTKSLVDALGVDASTLDGIDSSTFALDADLTTANVAEVTNLYYTDVRAFANLTSASTSSLSEGSNLYFTNARSLSSLVGQNISTGSIYTTGNINAEGEITSPYFYSESDIVLKEDVNPIDNALSKVLQLFGVSFKWKSNKQNSIGLIAQDVERVVPEIVKENFSGHKTVSYDSVIPLLIEAIKEQQKQIEDLKARLDEKH